MPTENRSSNTEMVSVPPYIGLEPLVGRYYPAQCRRCGWVGSSEELTEDDAQCTRDIGDRLCLGDCDELERHDLLNIIQAMTAPQPHPDPIAWMVGTAFWWTKEEAERDASETGLPIVGLGPMAGISPAEQHQDRPVVIQCPLCSQTHEQVPVGRVGGQLTDSCDVDFTTWRCGGCYGSWSGDPGDAGEVERLQLEIEKLRLSLTLNDDALIQDGFVRIENRSLRDRLAEQDKLLREIKTARDWNGSYWALGKRIDTALSTSAEPSTLPDPLRCNECTHADCGKFDGPRQVECRAMADNACARPGTSS